MGFFKDLLKYNHKDILGSDQYIVRGPLLFLYPLPFIDAWIDWSLSNGHKLKTFSRSEILKYLESEPGLVASRRPVSIHGKTKRCCVFYLENAPDELKQLLNIHT